MVTKPEHNRKDNNGSIAAPFPPISEQTSHTRQQTLRLSWRASLLKVAALFAHRHLPSLRHKNLVFFLSSSLPLYLDAHLSLIAGHQLHFLSLLWSLCSITFNRPSCLWSSRVFHLWLQQPTSASGTTRITVVRMDPIYTASIRTFTIIRLYLCYDFGCHLVPCSHGVTFKVTGSLCHSRYTASCHPRQDFWP